MGGEQRGFPLPFISFPVSASFFSGRILIAASAALCSFSSFCPGARTSQRHARHARGTREARCVTAIGLQWAEELLFVSSQAGVSLSSEAPGLPGKNEVG